MAQRVVTMLVSDLSGDEMEAGKGETINFSYRGVDYQIDLTDKEAAGFDKAIAMYTEHAQKTGGRRSRGSGSSRGKNSDTAKIKAWADEQGMDYPQRGRLPQSLIEAYNAAN